MNPNEIASLMEGSKKHVVVLKPLMNREIDGDTSQPRRKYVSYDDTDQETKKRLGIPLNLNWNELHQRINQLGQGMWDQTRAQVATELEQNAPHSRGEKRIIEADYVGPVDDATIAVCIEPGNFERYVTGFRASQLKRLRQHPELYEIKFLHAPNKFREDRGVYQVIKKFKKIMTINTANVESIDGKPIMALHDIEKGMKHIGGFDDEETVKEASMNQPKKYRIVMRRGTVIDADHMALLNSNSDIYMIGIGSGNGPTARRHLHTPGPSQCFDEFWMPITHTARGKSCKGMSDPSHSDYLVTPKFQKVITIHARNIDTINGKPILYIGDDSMNPQLGQFDEWNIGNIADMLGE